MVWDAAGAADLGLVFVGLSFLFYSQGWESKPEPLIHCAEHTPILVFAL